MSVPPHVDLHRVPGHVAIVVDRTGCSVGEPALVDVVDGALGIGLRWLTVDVVPAARWSAPIGELRALLLDVERVLLARRDELHARGVRICVLGRRDGRLPRRLQQAIDLLARKYPQYRGHRPVGPALVIDITRISGWRAAHEHL